MPRFAVLPNLLPARLDLVNYRGDSLTALLRLQHQGHALDISTLEFNAHIRASEDGDLLAVFTVIRVSDEAGKIRLLLESNQSQQLAGLNYWDLQASELLEPGSEDVARARTLVRGQFHSVTDITHPEVFGGGGTRQVAVARRRGTRRA